MMSSTEQGTMQSQRRRRLCHSAARMLTPFYRRYPYTGRMDLFKLDPRGCYSAVDSFFYNRIPKAANTTIVEALATHSLLKPKHRRRADPKYQFQRPLFLSSLEVRQLDKKAYVFTFVRNPFSRVLSAYLDKVGRRRHQGRRFLDWALRHGQPGDFLGFCRFLDAGALDLDMHWAPQADILFFPLDRFDFIGRVESLDHDLPYVLRELFGSDTIVPTSRRGTTTNANLRLQEVYGPEEQQIIARLYRRDFEIFGYSPELASP